MKVMKALIGILLPLTVVGCSMQPHSQSSSDAVSPNDSDPSTTNGDDAKGDDSQATNKSPSKSGNHDSVAAFKLTVYPLATKWCGTCHSTLQSPFFAENDVKKAHDAVLVSQKVDFENPESSRLYLRLSQDKHNCPEEGCDKAAKDMLAAIKAWGEAIKDQTKNTQTLPETSPLKLTDVQAKTVPGDNPDGVMLFEAESFTLKAPMETVALPTASGGMVIDTPANAGSVTNAQQATNNQNLGTATITFEVKTAGNYQVQGLVNGAAATNASFYLRFDGGALIPWVFTPTNADYAWATASPTATGAPSQFNLAAGQHTLEIRQRQASAKLDKLVISNQPTFDPSLAQPATRQIKLLTFDLSDVVHIQGTQLTVEVADYSQNGYLFKNPTLVLPSGSVHVKDLRLLINGEFLAQHATYTVVDTTVSAPGAVLSKAAMVALKDKGSDQDEFSFAFGTLTAK